MKPQGDVRWRGVESMRGTDRDRLCSYRRQGGGGVGHKAIRSRVLTRAALSGTSFANVQAALLRME